MDATELSVRELDALFDQAPVAMVFRDRELRTRRTNAAFRELTGLPDEALIGRRPSEIDMAGRVMDTDLIERTLVGQVMSGAPVVGMPLEQTLAGKRRVFAWSAYRVTDNGRVLGAVGSPTSRPCSGPTPGSTCCSGPAARSGPRSISTAPLKSSLPWPCPSSPTGSSSTCSTWCCRGKIR